MQEKIDKYICYGSNSKNLGHDKVSDKIHYS